MHSSFPLFIRLAYVWAVVAAVLGIWAASVADASGIWGASRHALTVGFLSTMVFCVGQRILPAFSGMRLLFSTKAMFLALLLLTAGCLMRVSSEVLAYQGLLQSAWTWLPVSAVTEMSCCLRVCVQLVCHICEEAAFSADSKDESGKRGHYYLLERTHHVLQATLDCSAGHFRATCVRNVGVAW